MCQTGFQPALTTPGYKELGYSVKLMKYIFIVPVLLIADVISVFYLLFSHMLSKPVKPIIQQGRVMCLKAFKYFVIFTIYVVTCCILLILFSVFMYIFLNNLDTTTVALLIADVIFGLVLLFSHMLSVRVKPIIQQGRVMCSETFKYFVTFTKHAVTCWKLLMVLLLVTYIFLNNLDTTVALLIVDVIFALYLLFNPMVSKPVKPIIQQGRIMCLKAFKYSVIFTKHVVTCWKLLIVILALTSIFLNSVETTVELLIAAVIFALFLFFSHMLSKPNF